MRDYSSLTSLLQIHAVRRDRVNREVTYFTRTTRSYLRIAPPLTPGTRPLRTNPHPRARRAGLVPGVAPGRMVTGKIEPCITVARECLNYMYGKFVGDV